MHAFCRDKAARLSVTLISNAASAVLGQTLRLPRPQPLLRLQGAHRGEGVQRDLLLDTTTLNQSAWNKAVKSAKKKKKKRENN